MLKDSARWTSIRDAAASVGAGDASRVEGTGFKVYRVSQDTIRIDLTHIAPPTTVPQNQMTLEEDQV